MRWDFYSRRKRVTLESFLSDCSDLKSAIEKFARLGLEPPSAESIKEAMDLNETPAAPQVAEKVQAPKASSRASKKGTTTRSRSTRKTSPSKTTKTTRTRRKAAPKKKEEPVQEASQEQTVETKDEKKQYFRKIIKPEKK